MSTILIDIDDVCANMAPVWLERYNHTWDDTLKLNNITDWNWELFVRKPCGKKIFSFLHDDTLYDDVKPVQGSLEGVELLRKLGGDIVFITAYDFTNSKFKWLKKHKFSNDINEFVVAHNKSLIKGDAIIDDNYENCVNHDGLWMLFDAPWNRKFKTIYRVYDWKEITDKIQLLNVIEEKL